MNAIAVAHRHRRRDQTGDEFLAVERMTACRDLRAFDLQPCGVTMVCSVVRVPASRCQQRRA
jgi:hypothetical protein